MSASPVEEVVNAVLYEGYILYPYRPSSRKNQQRFTFGRVYPQAYSEAQNGAEPCVMQTQCLWRAPSPGSMLGATFGFLCPLWREVGAYTPDPAAFRVVPEIRVDGHRHQTWQEATERTVELPATPRSDLIRGGDHNVMMLEFPAGSAVETLGDRAGRPAGLVRRRTAAVAGSFKLEVEAVDGDVFRVTASILNRTPMDAGELGDADAVLMRIFASAHMILRTSEGGEFLSLLDPPAEYKGAAGACKNVGVWPVLVGDEKTRERTTMLASPIILYDYPQIAPQSVGDLCDGGEIDEILTMRIRTLTDEEKDEMRAADPFARRILERSESLADEGLLAMHGAMRETVGVLTPAAPMSDEEFFNPATRLESVPAVGGAVLKTGDHVRIRPKSRADVMDMALAGREAIIEAIEQDAEDKVHLALVVADDPGRDLGMLRQPGHRFFYTLEEVEPL